MLIAHRDGMISWKPKYQILGSMRNYTNTRMGNSGFYSSGLGNLPTQVTVTQWFKFATYYPIGLSRSTFKYGNRNSGVGFGTNYDYNSGAYILRTAVVEGKYWSEFSAKTSTMPADYAWHHLAFIVKPGNAPTYDTVYVDGNLLVPTSATPQTAEMITPTGWFSLCGRDGGDGWETGYVDVRTTRVCVFGELFTVSDIMADYRAGMAMPKNTSLIHYWDATVENNKVIDKVGNWDLTFSTGCSISDDTPWTA